MSVSPAMGWYPVTAGQSVNIPLTGWSTASTPAWVISTFAKDTTAFPGVAWHTSSAAQATFGGKQYATLDNGGSATLKVTAPVGAASGSWGVFETRSEYLDAQGVVPTDGRDEFHFSPVGVYVP
jgi:hypothetical protein